MLGPDRHDARRGPAIMRHGLPTPSRCARVDADRGGHRDIAVSGRGIPAFYNATAFLSAFGHVVIGWLWLDQALAADAMAADGAEAEAFRDGKLRACRFFFEYELHKLESWLTPVAALSDVAASIQRMCFF